MSTLTYKLNPAAIDTVTEKIENGHIDFGGINADGYIRIGDKVVALESYIRSSSEYGREGRANARGGYKYSINVSLRISDTLKAAMELLDIAEEDIDTTAVKTLVAKAWVNQVKANWRKKQAAYAKQWQDSRIHRVHEMIDTNAFRLLEQDNKDVVKSISADLDPKDAEAAASIASCWENNYFGDPRIVIKVTFKDGTQKSFSVNCYERTSYEISNPDYNGRDRRMKDLKEIQKRIQEFTEWCISNYRYIQERDAAQKTTDAGKKEANEILVAMAEELPGYDKHYNWKEGTVEIRLRGYNGINVNSLIKSDGSISGYKIKGVEIKLTEEQLREMLTVFANINLANETAKEAAKS